MSDKKITEDIRELKHEAEIAPLLEGVEKIADHVVRSEKRVSDRVEEIDQKTARGLTDLEDKVEKGFSDMQTTLERRLKSRSILPHLAIEDVTEPLQAAANDRTRELMQRIQPVCETFRRSLGSDSRLADPLVAASLNQWFVRSTQLQCSKFAANREQNAQDFHKIDRAFRDMVSKAALQEGTTTEGGHLVPVIVEAEIMRLVLDAGLVFPRCRQVPMTSWKHDVPNESTAVTINWVSEEGTLTGGEPVFGKNTLQANKLAGRATMSIEVVEDSAVAILPYLLSVFTEKMGGELDFQTMEGTTPFTGVNTAANVNSVAATTATAGADLTYPKLVDIFVAGSEASTRNDAIWVMSPAIFGKLLALVDSNGQPIVKAMGTVQNAPDGTLLGRPIIVSARLGSFTVGSDATGNIYFGPPAKLLFGTRTGFRWDVTDQVNWATYQMDARLVGRFAYVVGVGSAWTKGTKFHND